MTALAAARAAAPGRRTVVCSEHAHSSIAKACRLLELDVRTVPGDERYAMRADGLNSTAPARSWPRSAPPRRARSTRRAARRRLRARRRLAARGCGLRRPGRRLPGAAAALRGLGAGRLGRREPTQAAARADGVLGALDAAAGRLPARVQPGSGVPAGERRGAEPQRVLDPPSDGLSGRSSSGRCCAASDAPACRRTSASCCAWRRCSRRGCAWSRAGRSWRRGRSRSSASGATGRTRTTPRSSSA